MKNNRFPTMLVCCWLAVLTSGCTPPSPQTPSAPIVPDAIQVSATEVLSLTANAKGVQVYECRPRKDDATKYEWVHKAPEADLFDQRGY